MNFSRRLRPPFILVLLVVVVSAGCARRVSLEEKAARAELKQALRTREFVRAIPLARRILEFAPNDDGAWARLARAEFGKRDLGGLEKTLADWKQAVPHPSAKYDECRGDLAHARRQWAEALVAWKRAGAAQEAQPRLFRKIARLEQAEGHWQDAVLAWTRAMTAGATAPALLNRAICYRHLHSWESARADLEDARQLAPQDALVRQEGARFDRLGKFLDEVRKLDAQLIILPNDTGLLGDRALLFLRAGDAVLALDDANQAAQLAPNAVRPKLFRALAQHKLGQKGKSPVRDPIQLEMLMPEFLQTLSRLDAELGAEPKSVELLTNRAWQLNEIGQPELALADAEAALESDANSAGACAEASYALAKLGRAAEADEKIRRATELEADSATAWQYRGELEMRRGDYTKAIESLSRALAKNQTAAALTKREECYRKLGLFAKAEDDRKALQELWAALPAQAQ